MKDSVQWNSVYDWKYLRLRGSLNQDCRSIGQHLTHLAAGAPSILKKYGSSFVNIILSVFS